MINCGECGSAMAEIHRFCRECGREQRTAVAAVPQHLDPFRPTPLPETFTPDEAPSNASASPVSRSVPIAARQHPVSSGGRPLRRRATWAQVGFVLAGLATVFQFGTTLNEISILNDLQNGEFVSFDRANSSDEIVRTSSVLALMAIAFALVAFLFWVHRANDNLERSSVSSLRFTPSWAVGWFFIPVMNLVRPYQILAEIWRASSYVHKTDERDGWQMGPVSPIVGWWWALWIVGTVIGVFIGSGGRYSTIDAALTADYWFLARCVVLIVALILAIVIVRRVTEFQERASLTYG